jgi:S1-C subfamily serine protease
MIQSEHGTSGSHLSITYRAAGHRAGELVPGAALAGPISVDPLSGGESFTARVICDDPVHDLAVLTSDVALPTAVSGLASTDRLGLGEPVSVTGHAVVADGVHTYRYLDAAGTWSGGTTRDDAVPLGCLTANHLMPGMSGAPVIRKTDPAVVGVVSGRYNTADGWLADNVWVARTEDLLPLLAGITDVPRRTGNGGSTPGPRTQRPTCTI